MRISETLEQYLGIMGRMRRAEETIRTMRSDIEFVRGLRGSKTVIAKIEKIIREIEEEVADLEKQSQDILGILQKVPEGRKRRILTAYYIYGETWEDIAYDEGISLRYLYRLRKDALEELEC